MQCVLNIAVAHCCVIQDVYAYRFTLDEQHFAQQLVHTGAESCELVLNCGALERGEDGGQQVEERIGQLEAHNGILIINICSFILQPFPEES